MLVLPKLLPLVIDFGVFSLAKFYFPLGGFYGDQGSLHGSLNCCMMLARVCQESRVTFLPDTREQRAIQIYQGTKAKLLPSLKRLQAEKGSSAVQVCRASCHGTVLSQTHINELQLLRLRHELFFPQNFSDRTFNSFLGNARPVLWEVSNCPLNGNVDDLMSLLVEPELSLIEACGCNLTGTLRDMSHSWRQGDKINPFFGSKQDIVPKNHMRYASLIVRSNMNQLVRIVVAWVFLVMGSAAHIPGTPR